MHVHCTGSGGPTVVLDTGASTGGHDDWRMVQPRIAAFTRVCSYDRAGFGYSDPGPSPRTAQAVVDDLRALLKASGEPAPYVLVGASLGGKHVRLHDAARRARPLTTARPRHRWGAAN
jgi:pimeloyl-ACP methyl ester carboxylesterase